MWRVGERERERESEFHAGLMDLWELRGFVDVCGFGSQVIGLRGFRG